MYKEMRFEVGDKARVVRTVRNDGSYQQGLKKGECLVQAGSVGFVRSFGYYLQNKVVYRVYFPDVDREIGVKSEELIDAKLAWYPNPYHLKQRVILASSLAHHGQLIASKGDEVTVIRIERDLESGKLRYQVQFSGRWVWLPLSAIAGEAHPKESSVSQSCVETMAKAG